MGGSHSSHSLRAGFATCARAAGVPLDVIAYWDGWSLSSVYRYLRHRVPMGAICVALFGWMCVDV